MTKHRTIVAVIAVLALFVVLPSVGHAWDGYGCRGDSWGYGWGAFGGWGPRGGLYSLGRIPVPPYYAIHPPVYYGERYFRSYGGSPYARSGDFALMRPRPAPKRVEYRPAVPVMIVNPHYQQAADAPPKAAAPKAAKDQVTSLMIRNPYYQPSATRVAAK